METSAPISQPKMYRVDGLDCANCAADLEKSVAKLDSVQRVSVDFATGKIHVSGEVPLTTLQHRAKQLGFSIHDDTADDSGEPPTPMRGGVMGFWDYLLTRHNTRLALMGGGLMILTALAALFANLDGNLQAILYITATGIAGYPLAMSGVNNLRINRQFNINMLMSIAAIGAIALGETLEAATVVFLFVIGEALEGYTTDRARNSIKGLMALAPAEALRLLENGAEETVSVELLRVDDRILVKAGERIPMDGVVLSGESDVNQAPITGESIPVHKGAGDEVYAGTVNGVGTLTLRVTRLAQDNTLSRIIKMVEEAQSSRAPSQRMIDRFAAIYTPVVIIAALLVAIVPPLFFGGAFSDWLYRALVMLVVACPCALVISTPVTVIAAITSAARRGVLIKGGAYLEALGTINAVAFDKTGTLTRGEPVVITLKSVDCDGTDDCPACDDLLALASAVEGRSTHPLAKAVITAADAHGVAARYPAADNVETLAGKGVRGEIGGALVTVGSHGYFHEQAFAHNAALCDEIRTAEANGQTTMLVGESAEVRGYVTVADQIRADSPDVIAALHTLGIKSAMLTGDNQAVANSVGAQIGVDDVRAGLLPEDKVAAVDALKAQYGNVAMVGDGVNDTPALAAATVSVAMGGAGTAQALETADIALMADDLRQLPFALKLARFTRRLIMQNVALTFAVKLVVLALALAGIASMWLAIFADVGMLLIVTINGMRPLRGD